MVFCRIKNQKRSVSRPNLRQALLAAGIFATSTTASATPITTKCVTGDGTTLVAEIDKGVGTLTTGNGPPNRASSRATKVGKDDVKVTVTSARSTGTVTISWKSKSGIGELTFDLDNGTSKSFPVRCTSRIFD